MKTVMNNFRMMTLVLVTIFTLAFATGSMAHTTGDTPAVFKYIGSVNDQPVFQLTLNNTQADQFDITIKDASGNIVYKEVVTGKDVTRKYKLNTDEIDVTGLKFEVRTKSNNNKLVYTVQKTGYYVEDMVVTRL